MSELIAALEGRRGQIATYTNCDFIPTAEYHALIDVAIAAEREREAWEARNAARSKDARALYTERMIDAAHDKFTALATLSRHLLSDATTAQDGAN